ncbi:MAG: hypothetical protein ACFB2Y_12410 [Fulvivirga sp.]
MSTQGVKGIKVSRSFYFSNFVYLSILVPINVLLYSDGFYPDTIVLGLIINGLVIWASSLSWFHSVKMKGTRIIISRFGKSDQFYFSDIKSIHKAPYGMKAFWRQIVVIEFDLGKTKKIRFAVKNRKTFESFLDRAKSENLNIFL